VGKRDPRVDAYIARSADFAKPILTRIRDVVHTTCPEVEEDLKWRMPAFMYKGLLCGMAAFKEHATFGFWKGSLVVANDGRGTDAMGQFGCLTKVSDLPPKKELAGYVKKAMELNDQGIKVERKTKPRPALPMPPALTVAFRKNKRAAAAFEHFSPSQKREYAEWIGEAKTDDTRTRRLETALEWIEAGKPRNWKYMT